MSTPEFQHDNDQEIRNFPDWPQNAEKLRERNHADLMAHMIDPTLPPTNYSVQEFIDGALDAFEAKGLFK